MMPMSRPSLNVHHGPLPFPTALNRPWGNSGEQWERDGETGPWNGFEKERTSLRYNGLYTVKVKILSRHRYPPVTFFRFSSSMIHGDNSQPSLR